MKGWKKRKEWTHGSLVDDGRVVIQISRQWGSKIVRKWDNENIEGSYQFGYSGSILPMKDHFPIEPGFCVTIYKAQVSLIYLMFLHPIELCTQNNISSLTFTFTLNIIMYSSGFEKKGENNKKDNHLCLTTPNPNIKNELGGFVCCPIQGGTEGSYPISHQSRL